MKKPRSSRSQVFGNMGVFKKSLKIHSKTPVMESPFNTVADRKSPTSNFIQKEAPAKVFSCEFLKNLHNTFFIEHPRLTAFEIHAHLILTE